MAEDNQFASPKNDLAHLDAGEDAEMRAARRELKQSSISDPPPSTRDSGHDSAAEERADACAATPAGDVSDVQNEDLMIKMSSPKKKRAHDQLDGDMQAKDNDSTSTASTDSAKDRASRLEPEKKRHRDQESGDASLKPVQPETQPAVPRDEGQGKPHGKSPDTSSSAFAATGFGKLAKGSSAFATLSPSQGSSFGSLARPTLQPPPSPKSSTVSQLETAAIPPKLTFGSNDGVSPFAGIALGSNGFAGKGGGGGFASAFSASKPLTTFAAPGGKSLRSGKAAKPFGAPDSDSDDGDDEAEEQGETEEQAVEPPRATSPDKEADDKRRTKLHKVEVDDGEAGEATIVSVRAKMFSLDKEAGWKERGAGMLKINVPRVCVQFDEAGAPIPGSFDASGLEDDDEAGPESKGHKVARLIMRQDQTHRVILNTVLVPAMQFQEKTSLKYVGILFTAFEGEGAKPVSVTMRTSAANAKVFMREIGMVQKELRGN
ncbi:hypothetical protein G6O67_000340 [Ophiocordyceps sinensis]|uniref:RanBD1 domain-containing protein n=2 Tax=Ophiocordyceps sinensis TaxID=72228 RepID=A0A8H4V9I7_9HYPO|nr:Pleckstrin-like protein [Ophiocordyceps sinensis CO18]KAF4513017.1 hypothetical protein G6O67_000340 [Ophiocordyceps sinensis]